MPDVAQQERKDFKGFKPRQLRVVEILDFTFRGTGKRFPAARVGRLQQMEGECPVRPTYCFRPKDSQDEAAAYPVRIRVYDMGGRLHGVADPLPEAQLTSDELLPVQQIVTMIKFEDGDRGLVARDRATGMFIKPAPMDEWIKAIGKAPVAGESYKVALEEHPNKFVAQPLKLGISETEVTTQALVVAARSGSATVFHQLHVMSADGARWEDFRKVLYLVDDQRRPLASFDEDRIRRAFRSLSFKAHPDKKTTGPHAEARQELARKKMGCLQAARDMALEWIKGCPTKLGEDEAKAKRPAGSRCGRKRVHGSGYCKNHGPADLANAIAEAAGVAGRIPVPDETAANGSE